MLFMYKMNVFVMRTFAKFSCISDCKHSPVKTMSKKTLVDTVWHHDSLSYRDNWHTAAQHTTPPFNSCFPGKPGLLCYINFYLHTYLARTPKLPNGHKWHRYLTGGMPFLSPNQQCQSTAHWLTELSFYVPLDTKTVISETFFLANLLVQNGKN